MRFESFWQSRFYPEPNKTEAVVQDATTSAMNKQIGGMEPLIYAEGKRKG
jgi:hypothetical protein